MTDIVQRIAAKAILVNSLGQVLIVRKGVDNIRHAGNSGRYNLPGGKIDPGEEIEDALKREVFEELSVSILDEGIELIFVGDWRPTVREIPHQIVGIFFSCHSWTGKIILNEEHDKYVWIDNHTLNDYDILPPEDRAIRSYFANRKIIEK